MKNKIDNVLEDAGYEFIGQGQQLEWRYYIEAVEMYRDAIIEKMDKEEMFDNFLLLLKEYDEMFNLLQELEFQRRMKENK